MTIENSSVWPNTLCYKKLNWQVSNIIHFSSHSSTRECMRLFMHVKKWLLGEFLPASIHEALELCRLFRGLEGGLIGVKWINIDIATGVLILMIGFAEVWFCSSCLLFWSLLKQENGFNSKHYNRVVSHILTPLTTWTAHLLGTWKFFTCEARVFSVLYPLPHWPHRNV